MLRDWSKHIRGWAGAERVRVRRFWTLRGSFNFQLPVGVADIWRNQQQGNSLQIQRTKSRGWKSTLGWCTVEMKISCLYCKIRTKAKTYNGMTKESQGINFQKTALCRHAGLQEHHLCPHDICPQGYGAHVHRSGTRGLLVMWLSGVTTTFFVDGSLFCA